MCGRARLATDYAEIKIRFKIPDGSPAPNLQPHWNIAPTMDMLAVTAEPARVARPMRWGLVPSWSKEAKPKFATFNARAETVASLPMFRGAWRAGRRCLIVTDGFYEWRKTDKQPFAISAADGGLTVMAGLWDVWRSPEGEVTTSCTVITTEANAMMAALHDRMPVIVAEADWPVWLGEAEVGEGAVAALLKPYANEVLTAWPVDKKVGSVRNDGPELAQPIAL